jgi:anti-sigma B factor antagonist
MQITEHDMNGTWVLALAGRFDVNTAPQLGQWFDRRLPTGQARVAIGMAEVNFIDSVGLSMLVQGMKRCRERQGNLVIFSLQQTVRMIFELTRLNKAFDIYVNEAAALHALEQ